MKRWFSVKALGAATIVLAVSWFGCDNRPVPFPTGPREKPKATDTKKVKKTEEAGPVKPVAFDPELLNTPELKRYYDKGFRQGKSLADEFQKDNAAASPKEVAKNLKAALGEREVAVLAESRAAAGENTKGLMQAFGRRAGLKAGLAKQDIPAAKEAPADAPQPKDLEKDKRQAE